MQLENFLQFFFRNITHFIEGSVAAIIVVVLLLAYRSFLSAKNAELHPSAAGGLDLSQLEESLKKILEKANAVPSASTVSPSGDNSSPLLDEISDLKASLYAKQIELEAARNAATAGGDGDASGGLSTEGKTALDSQIRELQAKLSEYEIISEDIADLSFYKEENVKLQKELESLKAGGASATPSSSIPTSSRTKESPAISAEEMLAASAAALTAISAGPEPTIVGKSMVSAASPERASASNEMTSNLAEVLPAAVEETLPEADLSAMTPAPDSDAPVLSSEAAALIDEDLMKEFAAAVEDQKSQTLNVTPVATEVADSVNSMNSETAPAAESVLDLGEMDMDKMLAEASGLGETVDSAVTNALEAGVDADKLLQEAATMDSVNPEDVELMGEFAEFKKENA